MVGTKGGSAGERDPAFLELQEAYRSEKLLLFVGAGVSAAAGLPSWKRLVELLVERASALGAADAVLHEIAGLTANLQFIDALSAIKNCVGATEFAAVIERHLDDRSHVVPEVARAISALAPTLRAILTTNIDHLLERAFGGAWPAVVRATSDIAQRRHFILKLHGTLIDRSTWVFTRDEYDRAMYADPRYQTAFSALFHAHTLLFVGFGLVDDDFDQLLGRVRALARDQPPRHFALVAAESVTPYRRAKLEAAGVRLIAYDNVDGRHRELARLLRALAGGEGDPGGASSTDAGGSPPEGREPATGASPQCWVHETTEDARYTGREDLIHTLDRWADDPSTSTIAVTGLGGLGKTALLGQWLKRHGGARRRGGRGLFFWSFYVDGSVQTFLRAFLRFAVDEAGAPAPAAKLLNLQAVEILAAVPLIVVLDGLEVVQDMPGSGMYGVILDPSLGGFLKAACKSQQLGLVLLTSRFPFKDLEEYIGRTFRALSLERMTRAEGASLLGMSGVGGTREVREHISEHLEGHPLALRIFAAALATQAEGDPTRFWDAVFERTRLEQGTRIEQKLSRLLAFYESHLPPVRTALLGIISMFRSTIDARTVLWLGRHLHVTRVAVDPYSDAALRVELFGIIEDGLLIRERGGGNDDLLTCHPILRDHFRASLLKRDARVAGQVAAVLTDRPVADRYESVGEVAPILDAIDILLAARDVENAEALYRQRLNEGRTLQWLLAITEGLRCTLAFVAAVADLGVPSSSRKIRFSLAQWHYHAAVFAGLGGELALAESHLEAAASSSVDDWQLLTAVLEQHAEVLAFLGRLFDAERVARQGITACGGPNALAVSRKMYVRLATILVATGQLAETAQIWRLVDSLRFNIHDEEEFRISLLRYDLDLRLGQAAEVYHLVDSLELLFRARGWSIGLIRCYLLKARASIDLGRLQEAEALLTRVDELVKNRHAFAMVAELLLARSALERARGALAPAVAAADEVLHWASSRQMRLYHIDALVARGRAILAHTRAQAQPGGNEIWSVVDDAEAALRLARGCGYVWAEREALVLLAEAHREGGDPSAIESLRKDADALTQKLGARAE